MPTRRQKNRTLIYKECKFQLSDKRTLQELMSAGFRRRHAAVGRFFPISASGETFHFVNLHLTHRGALCGNFFSYTAGQNQPFMKLDKKADHLDVNQLAPPVRDGERTEFLEGVLFFGVFGNAVILMQSNLLKADQFSRYLRWLIRDTCRLVPEEENFSLDDPLPLNLKRRRVKSVRRINITQPIQFHTRPISGSSNFTLITDDSQAMDLLSAAIPGARRLLSDLHLKDYVDTSSIRARVSIEWRGKAPKDGVPVLDDLVRELPGLDDEDDFELKLTDGTTIRRNELKKAKTFSILFEDSMPAFDVLFDRMVAWYEELQSDPNR
jgi:hypothetical protein